MEIIQLHHNRAVVRHRKRWKIMKLVTRNYWWPGIMRDMEKYVEGYNTCQRNKNWVEAPAGKLMPNFISEKLWSHILVDFIVKLPEAQECDTILVVYNCLTKMVHFIASMEKHQQRGLQDCLKIMYENCMVCLKA